MSGAAWRHSCRNEVCRSVLWRGISIRIAILLNGSLQIVEGPIGAETHVIGGNVKQVALCGFALLSFSTTEAINS
jgi:hypothetical protein